MRGAIIKCLAVAAFIAGLLYGILNADETTWWWGACFVLFIFVSIPLAIMTVRDLLLALFTGRSESFRAWMLVHVCAAFAAWVGYLLSELAKGSSPDPRFDRWLILLYPAMVYIAPALLAIFGGKADLLFLLMRTFRRKAGE